MKNLYEVGKESYMTIKQLATAYNLPTCTVQRRLFKGLSIEDAIKPVTKRPDTSKRVIVYNGKEYLSKSAFCKELGIKRTTFNNNILNRGMSLEEAVENALITVNRGVFSAVLDGVNYNNISDVVTKYNISISSVRYLYNKNKLTIKNINNIILKKAHNRVEVTYNDVLYPSYKALADSCGLKYHIFMNRLRNSWSLDEALTGNKTIEVLNECVVSM